MRKLTQSFLHSHVQKIKGSCKMQWVKILVVLLVVAIAYYAFRAVVITAKSEDLWKTHIDLTRKFVESSFASSDSSAVLNALMKNQEDIGMFMNGYFGGTGPTFTKLLKEHISQAGAIVADLENHTDPTADIARWYENADAIASLAPLFGLSATTLRDMMHAHLKTTIVYVTAIAKKEDPTIPFEDALRHGKMMADYLVTEAPVFF